jgi:hypothetical protein
MIGKTNAVSGSNGTPTEKVNITLSSNQPSASDLLGTKITLAYGAYSKEYIWEGRALTLEIPEYVIYTLSFSNVEGYATPSMLELEAMGDNVRQIEALYQSELIVVTVTTDNGISVAGQQVTINGVTTTLDATGEVSQKIPYGTAYEVSVRGLAGYETPATQSFTASQPSRYTTLTYEEIKLGVFIQDTNSKLWTKDAWDGSAVANGIAVLTTSVKFIMALKDGGAKKISGSSSSSGMTLTVYSSESNAIKNYTGVANTENMLSAYGDTSSYAAGYCNNFEFPNGKTGYLGSAGEWKVAYNNKASIEACLLKVGATAMSSKYYWSSTRAADTSGYNFFWALSWTDGAFTKVNVDNSSRYARAFTTYK